MESGKYRIERVLTGEVMEERNHPRLEAVRLVLMVVILCQMVGLVLVQGAGEVIQFNHKLPLGVVTGAFLTLLLTLVGSRPALLGASNALARLARDFQLSLKTALIGEEKKPLSPEKIAVELVVYLLDNGLTSESKLEEYLSRQGYDAEALRAGLNVLEKKGFITIRANGVNLIQKHRRAFI